VNFSKNFSILAVILILVVIFQNCTQTLSPVSFKDTPENPNQTESGTPYEGKIYILSGNLCDDGTEIHSRIVLFSSTKAELNREDCKEIAAVQLQPEDFKVSADLKKLTYKGDDFNYLASGSLEITNFSFSNTATNLNYSFTYQGQPLWLQVFLDTDNNPATGFSYNGIGADFLIENDNLWVYSAPAGSPPDTWGWSSVVSANKVNLSPNISWSIPRSSVGSPPVIKLMGQTSLGAKTEILTQIPN